MFCHNSDKDIRESFHVSLHVVPGMFHGKCSPGQIETPQWRLRQDRGEDGISYDIIYQADLNRPETV